MTKFFDKLFGFDSTRNNVRTEILAGLTTFLTMAYILAVNPSIFSALQGQGMDIDAVFTATALAAIVGTLVMSLYAKKPFALAPRHGAERLLCLYRMSRHGLQLAVRTHGGIYRRHSLYTSDADQCTQAHRGLDSPQPASCHQRRHRSVYRFHRTEVLRYRSRK